MFEVLSNVLIALKCWVLPTWLAIIQGLPSCDWLFVCDRVRKELSVALAVYVVGRVHGLSIVICHYQAGPTKRLLLTYCLTR